jgi:hypothetical protein
MCVGRGVARGDACTARATFIGRAGHHEHAVTVDDGSKIVAATVARSLRLRSSVRKCGAVFDRGVLVTAVVVERGV